MSTVLYVFDGTFRKTPSTLHVNTVDLLRYRLASLSCNLLQLHKRVFHLEPEDEVLVCDSQLSMNISSRSAILTITSIIMLSVSNALMKGVMPGALKYPGRSSLLHQRGYLCQSFLQLEKTNKPGSNDKKSHGRSTRQSFATKLVAGETLLMQTYLLRILVRYT